MLTGILLALFCGLIVGSLDNVLRPILVGKDTRMHELMIFFSTLGGLVMFGLPGLFIGPVIASLLISIWEIYGVEFADVLPEVGELLVEQVTQGRHDAPDEPGDPPDELELDLESLSESSTDPEQVSNPSGQEHPSQP